MQEQEAEEGKLISHLGGYFWTLSALTRCGYKCAFPPGPGQLLSDQDLTKNPAQPSLVCPRELSPALDQNHPSPGSCLLPSSWGQPKGPYGSQPPVAGLTTVMLLLHSWWLFQSITCSAVCPCGDICAITHPVTCLAAFTNKLLF